MSDNVHITKSGLQGLKWNPDVQQYMPVDDFDPMRSLRTTCHIDNGVTLRDIFNAVEAHPVLMDFLGNWAWCDCEAFHWEAKNPVAKPTTLQHIEVSKYIELDKFGAGETLDVGGVGPLDEDEDFGDRKAGEIIHWGIDFTPVNELADLPVILSPTVKVRRIDYDAPGPEMIQDLGAYPAIFTLLDVLGEIYYEISFHGSPDNRDERGAELRSRVEDLKAGTAKTVPFEFPEETIQ